MNPGYDNFMSGFLKAAATKGWDRAVREANLLEKVAQKDAFFEGKKDALESINELDNNDGIRGWFDFIKEANDSKDIVELCREAQNIDDESEYWQGYKQASEEASLGKSLDELRDSILGEPTKMSNFENGKFTAFSDLVKIAQEGELGLSGVHELINNTLSMELEKTASEDDVDFKLGVEALCHSFLKEASEVYAEYDLSDVEESQVIDFILEKVAEEADEKEKKKGMSTGAKAGVGAGLAALGAAGATAALARKGGGKASYNYLRGGKNLDGSNVGRMQAAKGVLRMGADSVRKSLAERKAKRSNKEASEQLDNEVLDALEALDRHGLLDELLGEESNED